MTHNSETIPLLVTLGVPGDDSFNLRFPPEYTNEIKKILSENGIDHGTALEFSAGPELAIEAVKILAVPGSLAALASSINMFLHRHDGKEFYLKVGEIDMKTSGFSVKDIEKLLHVMEAQQSEQNAQWQKMVDEINKGETDEPNFT